MCSYKDGHCFIVCHTHLLSSVCVDHPTHLLGDAFAGYRNVATGVDQGTDLVLTVLHPDIGLVLLVRTILHGSHVWLQL